jgi:hypothetical protein
MDISGHLTKRKSIRTFGKKEIRAFRKWTDPGIRQKRSPGFVYSLAGLCNGMAAQVAGLGF